MPEGGADTSHAWSLLYPTTAGPKAESQPRKHSSAALHIESLSARVIEMIRSRDWDSPDWKKILATDFNAHAPASFLEELPEPTTTARQTYIDSYRTFMQNNPLYDCTPTSIIGDVDEEKGIGKVWVVMEVTGHPPPLTRESVSIIYYARTHKGTWMAVNQVGLRGTQGS